MRTRLYFSIKRSITTKPLIIFCLKQSLSLVNYVMASSFVRNAYGGNFLLLGSSDTSMLYCTFIQDATKFVRNVTVKVLQMLESTWASYFTGSLQYCTFQKILYFELFYRHSSFITIRTKVTDTIRKISKAWVVVGRTRLRERQLSMKQT